MSGTSYVEPGSELDPVQAIRQFTVDTDPVASTSVFLDVSETEILPVARWFCYLLNAVEIVMDDLMDEPVVLSAVESIAPSEVSSSDLTMDPSLEGSMDPTSFGEETAAPS